MRTAIISSACIFLFLMTSTEAFAKKKRKKKKKKSDSTEEVSDSADGEKKSSKQTTFDAFGSAGMFSMTVPSETGGESLKLSGFSMAGLGHYQLNVGKNIKIPLGAGFRSGSASFSKDSLTGTVSIFDLVLDFGATYLATPSIGVGLGIQYDIAMGGGITLKYTDPTTDEEVESSSPFAKFSYLGYGPRFTYLVTDMVGLGFEYMMASGSYTTKNEDGSTNDPAKYTASTISGILTLNF